MFIKNKSTRNVSCLAPHSANGGQPLRFMVPAGSTLEVEDELYGKCEKAANALIKAGVLELPKEDAVATKKASKKSDK